MENEINKKRLILFGFVKVLQCELFGLMVFIFFWAVSSAFRSAGKYYFRTCRNNDGNLHNGGLRTEAGEKARSKVNLRGAKPAETSVL